MQRKRNTKKRAAIIVTSVLVAIGIGTGMFFGARAIYDSGVNDGRRVESAETAERVRLLGQVVQEKVDFQEKVTSMFNELPGMLESEGIDKYIENLNQLISQTNNEAVKSLLNEYLSKWQEFKKTYESKDNDAIAEGFNALKATVSDTAKQIKTKYDEAIKAAVQGL